MADPLRPHDLRAVDDSSSLAGLLLHHARTRPQHPVLHWLEDGESISASLTGAKLLLQAESWAHHLRSNLPPRSAVIIALSPGPSFLASLIGCWLANHVAIPCYPPQGSRHRRRLDTIRAHSPARLLITDHFQEPLVPHPDLEAFPEDLCLIQYTSGSTLTPKGVYLRASQLTHQLHTGIAAHHLAGTDSMLSWLPPYHDFGLILYWLLAPAAGIPLYAFRAEQFSRNPLLWLHAVSRYRIHSSGAPNFALDACSRLAHRLSPGSIDLSSWRSLPCGAERIQATSLDHFTTAFSPFGFSPDSFRPGYGLAEATLMVTAQARRHPPRRIDQWISCGTPIEGTRIRISPVADLHHPDFPIGEIQVRGPSVSGEYDSRTTTITPDGWLATGDLGWLDQGELFVFGRLKEMLIIHGVNHAPEDLETTVRSHLKELSGLASAVVATNPSSPNPEAFTFFQEIPSPPPLPLQELSTRIRQTLLLQEGLNPHQVILLRAGTLPRTTSGKIQRLLCLQAFASGKLKPLYQDTSDPDLPLIGNPHATGLPSSHSSAPLPTHPLYQIVAEITGRPHPHPHHSPSQYGIQSIEATQIISHLEHLTSSRIPLEILYQSNTFAELIDRLPQPLSPPPLTSTLTAHSPHSHPQPSTASLLPTPSQERMAFLHHLQPESAAYHVFGVMEIHGPLDLDALARSWTSILTLHPPLRTRHHWHQGQLRLEVLPIPPHPSIKEISNLGPDPEIKKKTSLGPDPKNPNPHPHLDHPSPKILYVETTTPDPILRQLAIEPFNLSSSPPVRIACIGTAPNTHLLALCAHHAVIDGYSIRILLHQWSTAYQNALHSQPIEFPEIRPSYFRYTSWLREHLASPKVSSSIAYWKARLRDAPSETPLPHDFPPSTSTRHHGAIVRQVLPPTTARQLIQTALAHRTTPATVLLTVFRLSLAHHGAGNSPVVAIPVANRQHPETRHLIGTFVNTLPFCQPIFPALPLAENLQLTHTAMLEMLEHQDAPFERIIEAVQPPRSSLRSPLTQVMFDHQEIPWTTSWGPDLKTHPYPFHRQAAQFELSFLSLLWPQQHEIAFEYQTDLFCHKSIETWLERFIQTLDTVLTHPALPFSQVACLTSSDIDFLRTHGQGPHLSSPATLIPQAIRDHAARLSDHPAIIDTRHTLTYGDLHHRIPRLATHFLQSGILPDSTVPIPLPRHSPLIESFLALWHLGASYLPLDPSHPKNRIHQILSDAQATHAIVDPSHLELLPSHLEPILLPSSIDHLDPSPPHPVSPQAKAYQLYTSGSTGKPKGVLISHHSLANFIASMAMKPGIQMGEILASITTASFDISGLEFYLPLSHGATIDLIPSNITRDAYALKNHLDLHPPHLIQATPATWRLLQTANYQGHPKLRLLCGGEPLEPSLAQYLHTIGEELWNLYGPTETTIWSTISKVANPAPPITIGKPIHHTHVIITDPSGTPSPPGVTGELWIGGDGVALGYWNRPELDSERFVNLSPRNIAPTGRYYRTGDLARFLPDGSIECLGRTDGQVKIRGFRVELAEIESALTSLPEVLQAAAILDPSTAPSRLIAFVVGHSLDPTSLTSSLRQQLPPYMIPASIIPVPGLPLTGSGKIDRRMTWEKFHHLLAKTSNTSPHPTLTPIEQQVATIWQSLLHCGPLDRHDDFFQLGGHSLLAAQMISQLESKTHLSSALSALFRDSSLSGFCSHLQQDSARQSSVILHQPSETSPNLFWIHTLIDAGQGLLPYRELVNSLPQFRSIGITCPDQPHPSFRDLASHHVTAILDRQPSGPYHLAGFCFGGHLAVEIAHQLESLGHHVDTLILLESSANPTAPPTHKLWHATSWQHLARQLLQQGPRWWNLDFSEIRKRLQMKHRAAADRLHRRLYPASPTPPDIHAILDLDHLSPTQTSQVHHLWTILHQHPQSIPQKVTKWVVIHTRDDGWLPKLPGLGWNHLSSIPIECHGIPGRHESFLRDQSTATVAEILRKIQPPHAIA